jgi:hypothetical protein
LKPLEEGGSIHEIWNSQVEANVIKLQTYADSLPGFKRFQEQQRLVCAEAVRTKKLALLAILKSEIKFSDHYVREHLTDNAAIALASGIQQQPAPSASMSLSDLGQRWQKTNMLIDQANLTDDLNTWGKDRNELGLWMTERDTFPLVDSGAWLAGTYSLLSDSSFCFSPYPLN